MPQGIERNLSNCPGPALPGSHPDDVARGDHPSIVRVPDVVGRKVDARAVDREVERVPLRNLRPRAAVARDLPHAWGPRGRDVVGPVDVGVVDDDAEWL